MRLGFAGAGCIGAWLVFAVLPGRLSGESCPPTDGSNPAAPAASVLHGAIRYHAGTRPWLGLVSDHPVCGAVEIELAFGHSDDSLRVKRMRGCTAIVRGIISEGLTAYYATDLNIFDGKITPDTSCHFLPADPDDAAAKIPVSITSYRVTVFIDVKADKPLRGEAAKAGSGSVPLSPWRAYAEISLNGEKDLDLACRDGFRIVSFSSEPRDDSEPSPLPGFIRLNSSDLGPASLTIECLRK